MAILRKAVVVLIALTVAGMLPAARSMPVDGANAACAVHAGATEDSHCEPSTACGAACAAALAIVYATVPMFAMPGYAVVWGWGALVFLGLALTVNRAAKRKAGDTQSMSRGDADVVG